MEKSRQFNQEQKLVILESAKEVGIKEASEIAGVHYTTVYEWRNKLEALGREGFLSCTCESRGRGIKQVTEVQEKGVLDTWERYPGFGPSQVVDYNALLSLSRGSILTEVVLFWGLFLESIFLF